MKVFSRRNSGKLYCIKSGKLVVSGGDTIPQKAINRFEVLGSESEVAGLGAGYQKTIWSHQGGSGWTKYHQKMGLGTILDIAVLNQKVLGLREQGGGKEIVLLNNNQPGYTGQLGNWN